MGNHLLGWLSRQPSEPAAHPFFFVPVAVPVAPCPEGRASKGGWDLLGHVAGQEAQELRGYRLERRGATLGATEDEGALHAGDSGQRDRLRSTWGNADRL